MEIIITETAKEILSEKIKGKQGFIKLKYDNEGCGCAVNGVPVLSFVQEIEEGEDFLVETNAQPILMEKSKLIFFDDKLKIDYSKDTCSFRLSSPNEILNGRMSFLFETND